MHIDDWLIASRADAGRRGLSALQPLLEALARSTTALREQERTARSAEQKRPEDGGDGR